MCLESRQDHFLCSSSRKQGTDVCDTHFIIAVVLEQGVLQHLRYVISFVASFEDRFREIMGAKHKAEVKRAYYRGYTTRGAVRQHREVHRKGSQIFRLAGINADNIKRYGTKGLRPRTGEDKRQTDAANRHLLRLGGLPVNVAISKRKVG